MSFAPYQPAPDEPPAPPSTKGKAKSKQQPQQRPWFPTQASSYAAPIVPTASSSYQSGAVPTFGATQGQGSAGVGGVGSSADGVGNQWETRFGWRVDAIAAWSYLFGPITALVILILETHNDYVRFHAYQSALAITPLFILHLILALSRAPLWLRWIYFIFELGVILALSLRAYKDANEGGLTRYRLPYIGDLADSWVGDE